MTQPLRMPLSMQLGMPLTMNHTEVSHELESFACIFCDSTYQCNEELNAHIENQHNADDANLSLKTRVLAVEMVLVRVKARV